MVEKKVVRSQLVKTIRKLATTVFEKWGVVETPYGSIVLTNGDLQIRPSLHSWRKCLNLSASGIISEGVGEASTDLLLEYATEVLPKMVEFLTSGEFQERIGSRVTLLNALEKAIKKLDTENLVTVLSVYTEVKEIMEKENAPKV